ncbi:MAG: hypothetical protein SPL13_03920 [Clostridia bacterium]|nr:hypothetical protein [Clostridia bacterium]
MEKLIYNRVIDSYKNTNYTVRKLYIDESYNVVSATVETFNATLNSKVTLTDDYKNNCLEGFEYIGDDGEIFDGDTLLYQNTKYDKVYPLGKLVINLYYKTV